jgi:DNA-binding transcriptional LysR family regulator
METNWLEDFLSLARTLNFSRSADERFVTQPAFSRRIKSLEVWVGVPLVDRNSYPIQLTKAGLAFKEVAEETLRNLYKGRDDIGAIDNSTGERIVIYASQALSLAFIPQWLISIREQIGEAAIRIVPDNQLECINTLIRGDCDFLLTFAHSSLPMLLDSDQYPYRVVGIDRMKPYSALDNNGHVLHELPGSASLPVPYLAYPPGVFLGKIADSIIENCDFDMHLQRGFENPMAEGLKYMAMEGHGMAWLPESSVLHEVEIGRLAPAGGPGSETALEIRFYRGRDLQNDACHMLWEILS